MNPVSGIGGKESTVARRRMLFLFPTRFHIFDQLNTPAFEFEDFTIYSIYPRAYFRSGRFAALRSRNRTLWLALGVRGLLFFASRMRARPATLRRLRRWYMNIAGAEFSWRTRKVRPALVIASAGYLGDRLERLRKAGHLVVTNHGSLYEPWVRAQMTALAFTERDQTANWADASLIGRMEYEFEWADSIILCSPTARDSFPERFRTQINIVPLGADLEFSAPMKPGRASGQGITFLHVSNLSFSKNVAGVLEAFDRIRRPGDRLIIVGPSPRDGALRRRLENPSPGVEWRGRQTRAGVQSAMAEADIFVHPSYADGWGMVITEALAAGLPIIASPHTGAASYHAAENPESITLVDPVDTAAIATAMREMAERLAKTPSLRPRPPISWDESARKLLDTLEPMRGVAPDTGAPD